MSLFICKICGMLDNSNLTSITIKGKDKISGYANMGIIDMHGVGKSVIKFNKPDIYVKEINETMMLCCECNTGMHHNEFDKQKPTDLEKEYATYSKVNYITKFDHPIEISLLKEIIDNGRYDYFKERIFELVNDSEYMGVNKIDIYYDSNKDEIYDRDSYKDSNLSKKLHSIGTLPYIQELLDMIPEPKPKVKQQESEKECILSKAFLKRLKRKRKKLYLNPVGNINKSIIDKEISDLENKIKMLKG